MRAAEVPPPSRSNAQKWPYDPNTLFITDPKIKGKSRSTLTTDYKPVSRTKKNQGGLPGPGTQQIVKVRKQC